MADLKTPKQLVTFFHKNEFDLVWALGPKAGLLGMIASWLCGIKRRMFISQGEVWAASRGGKRLLLKTLNKITASLANHLLAVSNGALRFLEAERVVPTDKDRVLGEGAISSVSLEIFKSDAQTKCEVRVELDIPDDAIVAAYLGRLDPDKGPLDLANAFLQAKQRCASLWLLIAGPDEAGLEKELLGILGISGSTTRYTLAGFTRTPARYLNAADLFCLPSYREGFPMTVLEAAALGLPSIGSDIYGVSNAIVDGQTGILVPVRDVPKLTDAIVKLGSDHSLRQTMGTVARNRVIQDVEQSAVLNRYLDYFRQALWVETGTTDSR